MRRQERERRAADPVEDRADDRAVPIGERQERGGADGRGDPRPDHERLPAPTVGREADGQKRNRRDDVADAEHEADVRRGRTELLQEQRRERREEPEADAPEDLSAEEDAGLAAEAYARPFTTPTARRSSNSRFAC